MRRYSISLSYDGTDYAGWQIQPNGSTVQEKLEDALRRLSSTPVRVHGSGRTDRGVHARQQVAHCDLPESIAPLELKKALNAILPQDIRISRIVCVPTDFHARRSAVGKQYRYFLWDGDVVPPFLRRYRTHVPKRLDVTAMNAAAAHVIGQHDFSAFTANPNREVPSTIRRLTELRAVRHGHEVVVIASSDGFLYKMVRSLVGLLIRVGQGDLPPEVAQTILRSRERTARVPTAPPQGLFLWKVDY